MANLPRGLIIFDVDGTLLNTVKVTIPAVQQVFAEFGLPLPNHQTVFGFIGRPASDFFDWVKSQTTADRSTELLYRVDQREMACISETGELYPGVLETIIELKRRHFQLAVCSNGRQDYVYEVLQAHGLENYFDFVRYRKPVDRSKSQMIHEISEKFSARPGYVVGDRHDDMTAARDNGFIGIAATYGFGNDDEWSDADYHIKQVAEVISIIEETIPSSS